MNESPIYHTVFVYDDQDRVFFALDYRNHLDATEESLRFIEDGYRTEILTLSTANLFDTAPDNYNADVERIAY